MFQVFKVGDKVVSNSDFDKGSKGTVLEVEKRTDGYFIYKISFNPNNPNNPDVSCRWMFSKYLRLKTHIDEKAWLVKSEFNNGMVFPTFESAMIQAESRMRDEPGVKYSVYELKATFLLPVADPIIHTF